MADFLNDGDITEFFNKVKPGFVLSEIPDYVRNSAYQEILLRTDRKWEVRNATQLLNGRGDKWIFSRIVPIVSVSSMKIIKKDLEEIELVVDQTDDERQVRFDKKTGAIELIRGISGIETDSITKFPKGLENVELIGIFGPSSNEEVNDILRLLQLLIMLRNMSSLDPTNYKTGIVQEKISRYSYKLSETGHKSVNEMIEDYYAMLPFSGFAYESV